ncbi:hypothetical protein EVAR_59167_1 [Eumeta japonica]|uniref:Uncharacterized protein n=1 Tax=Eumeta variegata TaxID=151549 RepID=A0A4C1YWZ5_EUMVA|nr:hypothetical protein EVAR_59167_1 [Eumeta japonica]
MSRLLPIYDLNERKAPLLPRKAGQQAVAIRMSADRRNSIKPLTVYGPLRASACGRLSPPPQTATGRHVG